MLMRCKGSNAKNAFGSFTLGICMIICTVAIVPLGETVVDYDRYGCLVNYGCAPTDSGSPFGKPISRKQYLDMYIEIAKNLNAIDSKMIFTQNNQFFR